MILKFTGDYLIVIIDKFSRFPVVEITKCLTAEKIIPIVDKVFSMFSYPSTTCDEDSNTTSDEDLIEHIKSIYLVSVLRTTQSMRMEEQK